MGHFLPLSLLQLAYYLISLNLDLVGLEAALDLALATLVFSTARKKAIMMISEIMISIQATAMRRILRTILKGITIMKMRISASNLVEMEKVENVQVLLRRISCSVDEKAVR